METSSTSYLSSSNGRQSNVGITTIRTVPEAISAWPRLLQSSAPVQTLARYIIGTKLSSAANSEFRNVLVALPLQIDSNFSSIALLRRVTSTFYEAIN
ncbi:hypothetical protein NL676_001123 [Syzygium grande]|nr:hypothetical protein NL676_001123 [Syzygium grande]